MLRFLVCDMGNVLIRFDPELFFDRLEIYDPGDRSFCSGRFFAPPCGPSWTWACSPRRNWKRRCSRNCRTVFTPLPTP